jgi:hypothetical protein
MQARQLRRGLRVSPLSEWETCKPALEALGYDYAEGAGVPGHHIFGRRRDRTERTHLVHVVEYLGESWRACLAFRDALRRDAGLRESYAQEKERAAAAAPGNRAAYNRKRAPSSPNPSGSFRRAASPLSCGAGNSACRPAFQLVEPPGKAAASQNFTADDEQSLVCQIGLPDWVAGLGYRMIASVYYQEVSDGCAACRRDISTLCPPRT